MIYRFKVFRPDQPTESGIADLPRNPSYPALKAFLLPLLGSATDIEHVTVLADFAGGTNYKRADMFVDEMGAVPLTTRDPLPVNSDATAIYQRYSLTRHPGTDPKSLPAIHGPAVLFERIVWT